MFGDEVVKFLRKGPYRVLTGVNVALGILTMIVFLEGMGFMAWGAVEANRAPNSPKLSKVLKVFVVVVFVTFFAYGVVVTVWPAMRCCG